MTTMYRHPTIWEPHTSTHSWLVEIVRRRAEETDETLHHHHHHHHQRKHIPLRPGRAAFSPQSAYLPPDGLDDRYWYTIWMRAVTVTVKEAMIPVPGLLVSVLLIAICVDGDMDGTNSDFRKAGT